MKTRILGILLVLAALVSAVSQAYEGAGYWERGTGPGSFYYWNHGTAEGSEYYWNHGHGPGSKDYWLNGRGEGSRYYWLNGDGVGSLAFWNTSDAPGSKSYWEHGTGPGSRWQWEGGREAVSWDIVQVLIRTGSINAPFNLTASADTGMDPDRAIAAGDSVEREPADAGSNREAEVHHVAVADDVVLAL